MKISEVQGQLKDQAKKNLWVSNSLKADFRQQLPKSIHEFQYTLYITHCNILFDGIIRFNLCIGKLYCHSYGISFDRYSVIKQCIEYRQFLNYFIGRKTKGLQKRKKERKETQSWTRWFRGSFRYGSCHGIFRIWGV